ncbi:hypothetical protein [uncultured Dokdonia sp.]|uniref:hypothetical protein n=1 Tax=uncultured Dokdonia sp. TaxID=575653 RepID=UPI0026071531|nr:hypothetical protein [uncultured Dokdonia sp.]
MATITSDEKTTSIITYFTIIGLIIGIFKNNTLQSEYISYHIRNMVGLSLIGIAISLLHRFHFPSIIINTLWLAAFVLWVIGFVGAVKGDKLEIPFIGKFFQDWFKSI